jgi:hypothetical protein
MVNPICTPMPDVTPIDEGRNQDHLVELLECLADLRVEIVNERLAISEAQGDRDPRVREVVESLADLEVSVSGFSAKAAAVRQLAQRLRLL